MKRLPHLLMLTLLFFAGNLMAQHQQSYFGPLNEEWDSPSRYRMGSGAPGPEYFQQKADYDMDINIDEVSHRLDGDARITYTNNSPESLHYIWLQLDQNRRLKDGVANKARSEYLNQYLSTRERSEGYADSYEGGYNITALTDMEGNPLKHRIESTMMRIELPQSLAKGESFDFNIKWWFYVPDYGKVGGRSGYEPFEDGNNIYVIAQFFPRVCSYDEIEGWQNDQFFGRGEFSLEFGDYKVRINVPADFMVGSTGTLQNEEDIFSKKEMKRLKKARKTYDEPVIVRTQKEVEQLLSSPGKGRKVWAFHADNVRDFGFAASRRFIYDAMAVDINSKTVMAESFYPPEGNPLWEEYSTRVVAHTLEFYSDYTFDYPYPKAISVSAKNQGMEYPMICWNFGRPDADGNYTERLKYGMMGVIIHEVGHNFFPMIVNSDERKWGWMDEGINSFVQYLCEISWDPNFKVRSGPAVHALRSLKRDPEKQMPIMTPSDYTLGFGFNQYQKPATALNILRETVLGHENFDYAFKTYSQRWMFKRPKPEDFFRTMSDASGHNLDWFWRTWFYTTDVVDIALGEVKEKVISKMMKSEREVLQVSKYGEGFLYEINFERKGAPSAVLMRLTFEDGEVRDVNVPAEIFRYRNTAAKTLRVDKRLRSVQIDPDQLTGDIQTDNHLWENPEMVASSQK